MSVLRLLIDAVQPPEPIDAVRIVLQLDRDVAPVDALAEQLERGKLHRDRLGASGGDSTLGEFVQLPDAEVADAADADRRMQLASCFETAHGRNVNAQVPRDVAAREPSLG